MSDTILPLTSLDAGILRAIASQSSFRVSYRERESMNRIAQAIDETLARMEQPEVRTKAQTAALLRDVFEAHHAHAAVLHDSPVWNDMADALEKNPKQALHRPEITDDMIQAAKAAAYDYEASCEREERKYDHRDWYRAVLEGAFNA